MAIKVIAVLLILQGMAPAFTGPVFRRSAVGEMVSPLPDAGKKLAEGKDCWACPDKAQHFMANVIMTTFIFSSSRKFFEASRNDSRTTALIVSSLVSFSKEVWDLKVRHRGFSKKDLTADLLGILAGLILINQ